MVRIQIILHFREILHRLLHLGIVPPHVATEQIRPALWSDDSKKRVLKELGGGPNSCITKAKSGNAGSLQPVASREELVKGHFMTNLDSIPVEKFFVVPKN